MCLYAAASISAVEVGGVAGLDLDHPALAVGVGVDRLGRGVERLVDGHDGAGDGQEQVGDRLHGLDGPEHVLGVALHPLFELDEHDVAELAAGRSP